MLKPILLAFVLPGLLVPTIGWAAEPTHIGTVSPTRLAAEATEFKAALQQLETLRLDKTREITEKQRELEAARQRLVQENELSKRERFKSEEERGVADLMRLTQQAQVELQTRQRQIQETLRGRLAPILADIAKRQNLETVLNADAAVLWSATGLDITTEVIERLNAPSAGGAVKAPGH